MWPHGRTVASSSLVNSLPPTGFSQEKDSSTWPSLYDASWLPVEPTTTSRISAVRGRQRVHNTTELAVVT